MDKDKTTSQDQKTLQSSTPEICLEAVKQNDKALHYVREQTPEMCLAAVKHNGNALEFVKEQTPNQDISIKEKLMRFFVFLQEYNKQFTSYGTGLIGSIFFLAIHGIVEGSHVKDILSLIHMAYGLITFIPCVVVNLFDLNNNTANGFFAGTITPFLLSWFIKQQMYLIKK